ncbi:hypothetical protein AB1Y20_011377 [Prymnesium parvum]|uniref:Sulfatase-modifying factor enzyme-like domain-containing protein n=1 Tax=Prymnesium parvum TaxID=97485 RepID=A0AB34IN23_PRYPA
MAIGVVVWFAFVIRAIKAVCGPCQTPGPTSRAAQPQWLAALKLDRETTLAKINFTGGSFSNAALLWTQRSYIQPQVHPYDRYFFNETSGEYTVDRFLGDLKQRYGGIDSLLLWPTYTNLGIDARNQFDCFRTMPGGLDAVTRLTASLKAAGVRVLWPYNPWDEGTRKEPLDEAHTIAALLQRTGSDGFNGDTMDFVPERFWKASVDVGHPLALEPEIGGTDASLNWQTLGWGYWTYAHAPPVDRFKFLTRGKFMTHVCDRWAKRKTDNLQAAWFNGAGYESWENVWGTWNGIVPRDAEAIRRVATMLRFFGGPGGLLQSAEWEPHVTDALDEGVFASRFPNGSHTLYTLVNRAGESLPHARILVPYDAAEAARYFDCYHGVELHPSAENRRQAVSVPLEVDGYGCVLGVRGEPGAVLHRFLLMMESLTRVPLQNFSAEWKYLPQTIVTIPRTARATTPPAGMIFIPAVDNFTFESTGLEIEGDDAHGVDVQFPWEPHPQKEHAHTLSLPAFYIDKYPATNANYSRYLKATGYRPKDRTAWLQHWRGASEPSRAIRDAPVTYISLHEAREYCAWRARGSRLPHAYEWQYAAQGLDGRQYPWGKDKNVSNFPARSSGNSYHGPEPVTAHAPGGDSPFGVSDLVGNVWQYTDEFRDEHTRAVILRGGSNHRPTGSKWYFPNEIELGTHNKYFLFSDSYERAATIGVRCVKDAIQHQRVVNV